MEKDLTDLIQAGEHLSKSHCTLFLCRDCKPEILADSYEIKHMCTRYDHVPWLANWPPTVHAVGVTYERALHVTSAYRNIRGK